ncbi:hypothetical protein CCC_01567 [Paramagnetospirillum magnetotacticum MS-1]|uniref:Uncharacterized protein n=1 Tax=Paramagnetospirillum magnetotacticum MS-1 TaxID=272627 RepID=A0A0C2UV49_PARME|nr:hypothetical protein [Paramagnetospirillum magnetotacticum]KIL96701.1 hypothetical protein CCC_01567 [Paramagnetospirillum magnetotacticum MS-1]
MVAGPFLSEGLAVVPRVLGLADRQEDSPTYGCCDRAYWHYRTTDFPNVRFQEAGLLFALAHGLDHPGNRFHAKPAMARWARAAWRFWLGRRNRDGSFAEAYPGDRGFCGTSFSAAAFVETVRLLGGAEAWAGELAAAAPSFAWLAANDNPEVANQRAGSVWALAGYARLTGDGALEKTARIRLNDLLCGMDGEGWFPEYGGGDTGYQSITMAALVLAGDWLGHGEALSGALTRAETALASRLRPDGRVADIAANSRGTQFVYPSALVRRRSPVATALTRGLAEDVILRPAWMDDRYCIALAIDHLMAGRETAPC